MNWIPCDNELPNGAEDEVACLVTCQEWDLFDGKWGDKEVRILSYSIKRDFKVELFKITSYNY